MAPVEVIPVYTQSIPVLDGKLDDRVWTAARSLSDFISDNRPAKARTKAMIAYSDTHLFIAFDCQDVSDSPRMLHRRDGAPVWQDESVEVFIAPMDAPDESGLHQFVVNIAGAKTYLQHHEARALDGWQAAVERGLGSWSAELSIPFSAFPDASPNASAWRIVFCRNALDISESSSWPNVKGRFANYWNYALLRPEPGKPSFLTTRIDIAPLAARSEISDGAIPVRQAPLPVPARPLIIPEPQRAEFNDERFRLNGQTRILVGQSATHQDMQAARVLAEWVEKKTGLKLAIERVNHQLDTRLENAIVLGESYLNPFTSPALRTFGMRLTDEDPGPEGYVLGVNRSLALGAGSDMKGTFWAAQTMAQMIQTDSEGNAWIAGGKIWDKPAFGIRSVHLLTAKDTLEFQTRLISEILSPFKINMVILQMDKFKWESRPEVTDPYNHVTAEELRKLIAFARDHHITYVPLVMSLGHMEWIFRDGHNLDIAEDPNEPFAYCPLNEKSYELIYDLFNEAYAIFGRPQFFHIGHDEFDMRGEFPTHEKCRELGSVELYYRDTQRLTKFLRDKGAQTLLWGDILQQPEYAKRLDELPKDIIVCDWAYSPKTEYPSVDLFRGAGFPVIGCTWYDPRNVFHFSNHALDRDAVGMMQTTWSGWKTADKVLEDHPEQMIQYVYGAEWAWSPKRPSLDTLPYDASQVFKSRWGIQADERAAGMPAEGELFAIDLAPWANISTVDSARHPGWLGIGAGEDFGALDTGLQRLGELTYKLLSSGAGKPSAIMLRGAAITSGMPASVAGIRAGSTAKQLWFLHTSAYPDGPGQRVGEYTVHYQDGTSVNLPLIYGENITAWTDDRPAMDQQTAWRGQTDSGRFVRLRTFAWNNPHPDKIIDTIDLKAEEGNQASVTLFAITGVR